MGLIGLSCCPGVILSDSLFKELVALKVYSWF